jgi:hypothetical protein
VKSVDILSLGPRFEELNFVRHARFRKLQEYSRHVISQPRRKWSAWPIFADL